MPQASSSSAATPFPSVIPSEKVPSWILPFPQEGLLDFRTAAVQPKYRASRSASFAPFSYCAVTSVPSFVSTRSPTRSAGGRGVARPP